MTPITQFDAVYGLNNQIVGYTTVSGATVDTNRSRFRLQSGTGSTNNGAIFYGKKIIQYRAGQGNTARFTCAYTTGVTGSIQICGVGTADNGYFFGYSGDTFGIVYKQDESGSTINTFIPQSSWNQDKCDGSGQSAFTINPTYGNVFMIRYPFLGYGNIFFFIQNQATGAFILCHIIQYTNTTEYVELGNPRMRFYAQCANTGANVNNLTMYIGSVGMFLNGERYFTGPQWSTYNRKTSITTETNVLTIKNATTYNGRENLGVIRLRAVSLAFDAPNGQGVIFFKKNATLGGTPSYATISGTTVDNGVTITNGQSIASVDVAGTTVGGGIAIYNTAASDNTGNQIDLTPYEIFILPGDTLTVSAYGYSSGAFTIAINWQEDI
jgi:hypothetical protein